MKITVFTSNQARHIHFINKLSSISETCFAVIDGNTIFPGKIDDFFMKSDVMKDYF